ncbi:MAG: hypothetical protein IK005_04440, partial [Paludibacteraceae bacterium]|nr:hypothetical protein [Paludibacteraceae bacterium]
MRQTTRIEEGTEEKQQTNNQKINKKQKQKNRFFHHKSCKIRILPLPLHRKNEAVLHQKLMPCRWCHSSV